MVIGDCMRSSADNVMIHRVHEAERTSQYSRRLASDTSCWMAASRWTANYAAGAQRPPGNTPREAQG